MSVFFVLNPSVLHFSNLLSKYPFVNSTWLTLASSVHPAETFLIGLLVLPKFENFPLAIRRSSKQNNKK